MRELRSCKTKKNLSGTLWLFAMRVKGEGEPHQEGATTATVASTWLLPK